MSSNTGLHLFLQKTAPTDEQLFALIALRHRAMKPLFEEHVQTPLSQHTCYGSGSWSNMRFGDQVGEYLGQYLHYHGDMRCLLFAALEAAEEGTVKYVYHWGLDPMGMWLLIKAGCQTLDGKQVINNVWVESFETAEELCQKIRLKPRDILNHLYETILNWTDAKKAEFEELQNIKDAWLEQNYALKELEKM